MLELTKEIKRLREKKINQGLMQKLRLILRGHRYALRTKRMMDSHKLEIRGTKTRMLFRQIAQIPTTMKPNKLI